MKTTELEFILLSIFEQLERYEQTLLGIIAVGVQFNIETDHTHIRVFCQNGFFTGTSLIGFYQLDEYDFEWLKEKLFQKNFCQGKDATSFIKFIH